MISLLLFSQRLFFFPSNFSTRPQANRTQAHTLARYRYRYRYAYLTTNVGRHAPLAHKAFYPAWPLALLLLLPLPACLLAILVIVSQLKCMPPLAPVPLAQSPLHTPRQNPSLRPPPVCKYEWPGLAWQPAASDAVAYFILLYSNVQSASQCQYGCVSECVHVSVPYLRLCHRTFAVVFAFAVRSERAITTTAQHSTAEPLARSPGCP